MTPFSDILPVSTVKTHLSKLIKRIKDHHESFAITQRGKIVGVLIGYEEFESLSETLEILSDRDLMDSIAEGLKDEKSGRVYPHDEISQD